MADVPVWCDFGVRPGDPFEPVIRSKIDQCAAFMVVMTPSSAESAWVAGEITQAVEAKKTIIPLLLSACDVPVPLKGRQYEDVSDGRMPGAKSLAMLRDLVGSAPAAPPPRPDPPSVSLQPGTGLTEPPFTPSWPPMVTTAALRDCLEGHDRAVYSLAIATDGTWLASAGEDGTTRIWDMQNWGTANQATRFILRGHTDRVTAVAIAPSGLWLASASDDNTVRIWDARTGRCHATLMAGRVSRLAITLDGTLITATGAVAHVWDLAKRRVHRTLDAGHKADRSPRLTAMAVAPDGTWLVTGDDAGTVRVWHPAIGELLDTEYPAVKEVTAIVIAADGSKFAAACDDGTLRTWNHDTGKAEAAFAGHAATKVWWQPPVSPQDYRFGQTGRETVWAVAIAPDATWLATAESDRVTRVWETSTGDVRAVLRVKAGTLRRRAGTLAVVIAPDGRWLATGDSEGAVRIWDVSRLAE